MKRWKIYRGPVRAAGPMGGETFEEVYEGEERGLYRRLEELRTVTGKNYRAEPMDDGQGADAAQPAA